MNLIVAVDSNWAIGKENKLLVSIPQDMKFFRETTKGKRCRDGKKDTGKLSGRTAAEEPSQCGTYDR